MKKTSETEKKCYVWTRVSTKYQEDNGGSLDNQRCKCETYAREHGFTIVDHFGGKHESAKTPGRLVKEMIKAIKKDRSVKYIIVTEADRLSRNAGQGTTILNDLVGLGVTVVETLTGLDTSTPAGLMMIQMKVCMSQWDNTNRVDKFVSGRKHCLEMGVFTGHRPEGYDKQGKSINTTYIPPTSRTVNEGSKTRAQYNYITKQNDYITTQKNRTIHEGGYTQETKTIDLFLELAALDAKRINDPKMTHPPIVWQSTSKRHVSNPAADFDSEKELQDYATWAHFPFGIQYSPSAAIYAPLGISYSKEDPTIITNVKAGSRAQQAGLKIGDKLLKAETPDSKYVNKDIKKAIKNSGWENLMQHDNLIFNIEILRDGNKMKLTLNRSSKVISRFYWKK